MLHAVLHSADDLFNSDGAWWILAMDGILLVPLIFAMFFYPMAVLIGVVVLLVLTVAVMALVRVVHKRSHVKSRVVPGL